MKRVITAFAFSILFVTIAHPQSDSSFNTTDEATIIFKNLAHHPYFNFSGAALVRPEIERKSASQDVLFYAVLGLLFYFGLIRSFFNKYVSNLVAIFLRITLKQQQLREQLLQAPLPSLLLNIHFLLSGGFYLSLLLKHFQTPITGNFWLQTLDCIALLTVIYLGKFIVLKAAGWIFHVSRATDTYIFIVFLVNKMLGIILLPFIILLIYEPLPVKQVLVTLSLIFISLLFLYRFIFSFRPLRTEIKMNLLHFFIYLCAFEIAPVLLIYKVLLSLGERSN